MKKVYHILNGDCLNKQLPTSIEGDRIIARLCLVDGDVNANDIDELIKIRAKYISNHYKGYTEADYFRKSVPEIRKVQNISEFSDVNLWFEDDLYCQVNFWFIAHLLAEKDTCNSIYLIRPNSSNRYNFGGMTQKELLTAHEDKITIKTSEVELLSRLWLMYQKDDGKGMLSAAQTISSKFTFLLPAINAHLDRTPIAGSLGRPCTSLQYIISDLDTSNFDLIFQEFCKREPIYGFGDIQVKHLLETLQSKNASK